ncbi:MAG: hypothetical protein U1D55_00805 [Phycisphaerae bacterium]
MRARSRLAIAVAVSIVTHVAAQSPTTPAFSYQGRLLSIGAPLNGNVDMTFSLWDDPTLSAPANQVGSTITFDGVGANPPPVTVANGLFTVALDFGFPAFDGNARWVEVSVRFPAGSGVYTTLTPRQPITVAPYAIRSLIDNVGGGLTLPYAGSTNSAVPAFQVTNTGAGNAAAFIGNHITTPSLLVSTTGITALRANANTGDGIAVDGLGTVQGISGGTIAGSTGVRGISQGPVAVTTYGVYGTTNSANSVAAGVYGTSSTGPTQGVFGETTSTNGGAAGVWGRASGATGATTGVLGWANSSTDGAAGVAGTALSGSGVTRGVTGTTNSGSDNAAGVLGSATSVNGVTFGVLGTTVSSNDTATGVSGIAGNPSGRTFGVQGQTLSTSDGATGVTGTAFQGNGATRGVEGRTNSIAADARGVSGIAAGASGATKAVYGNNLSVSANAIGVEGIVSAAGVAVTNYGVKGTSNSTGGFAAGVYGGVANGSANGVIGETTSVVAQTTGVWGRATGTTGQTYGVWGNSQSTAANAAGVFAEGNGVVAPGFPKAAALEINNGAIRVPQLAVRAAGVVTTSGGWTLIKSGNCEACPLFSCQDHCHTIGGFQDLTINNSLIIGGQSMIQVSIEGAPPAPASGCWAQVISTANGSAVVRVTAMGNICCATAPYTGTVKVNYLIINP